MEITYLGHSSFRIRGRSFVGGLVNIVTDPYSPNSFGQKFPKLPSVDITTISHEHQDHANREGVKGEQSPKILSGPGEYEVKGVIIKGVATYHDSQHGSQQGKNTVFVFDFEGIRIVHLGDLGHKLTENQLSEIGAVNVLFVPVGGGTTIGPEEASEVVAQLEPNIVIPMHYKVSGASGELSNLADVSEFEKVMGVEAKRQDKLDIKGMPQEEEIQVVVLEVKC